MSEANLKKSLELMIGSLLKPLRFTKRGSTWNLRQQDFVLVLNLQKAPLGYEEYYVNVGIYFPQLDSNMRVFVTHISCHVSWRLYQMDELLKNEPHEASLERLKSNNALLSEVENMLQKHLLPLIGHLNTLEDVKEFIKSKPGYLMIIGSAHKLLGISSSFM